MSRPCGLGTHICWAFSVCSGPVDERPQLCGPQEEIMKIRDEDDRAEMAAVFFKQRAQFSPDKQIRNDICLLGLITTSMPVRRTETDRFCRHRRHITHICENSASNWRRALWLEKFRKVPYNRCVLKSVTHIQEMLKIHSLCICAAGTGMPARVLWKQLSCHNNICAQLATRQVGVSFMLTLTKSCVVDAVINQPCFPPECLLWSTLASIRISKRTKLLSFDTIFIKTNIWLKRKKHALSIHRIQKRQRNPSGVLQAKQQRYTIEPLSLLFKALQRGVCSDRW